MGVVAARAGLGISGLAGGPEFSLGAVGGNQFHAGAVEGADHLARAVFEFLEAGRGDRDDGAELDLGFRGPAFEVIVVLGQLLSAVDQEVLREADLVAAFVHLLGELA